jgi:hypothetical protein
MSPCPSCGSGYFRRKVLVIGSRVECLRIGTGGRVAVGKNPMQRLTDRRQPKTVTCARCGLRVTNPDFTP